MNLTQQRLGDYVLSERITHEGAADGVGTGVLYRAVHATSNHEVIVRVLDERFGKASELAARFASELEGLRRLEHPAIARVLEHGVALQGFYVVLENLVGETLAARLRRERLPLAETQRIVGHLASALAAAHRERIAHGALTAESIFLADGAPKIVDLGPSNLAPDAAEAGFDQRADIRALGSLTYEMLSGQPPRTPAPVASGEDDEAAEANPNARKGPARLADLGVTVPASVETAITKALARKKKRRFSSMVEFAEALGVPIAVSAGGSLRRTQPTRPVVRKTQAMHAVAPKAPPPPPGATKVTMPVLPAAEAAPRVGLAPLARGLKRPALFAIVGGAAAAAFLVVWFALRSGGDAKVVNDNHPAATTKPQLAANVPAKGVDLAVAPKAPAAAPSRVDEILALNQKAVTAYGKADYKAARTLLLDADRLAVESGYKEAPVRAQTQVRLGALWIAGQKKPRVGRRHLAMAVAINPAVNLPPGMTTPAVRKVFNAVRDKAQPAKSRAGKRANAKLSQRHGLKKKRSR
jgi:hypothetical protein